MLRSEISQHIPGIFRGAERMAEILTYRKNRMRVFFSLSDCTMDTAREFINTILEYAITEECL